MKSLIILISLKINFPKQIKIFQQIINLQLDKKYRKKNKFYKFKIKKIVKQRMKCKLN